MRLEKVKIRRGIFQADSQFATTTVCNVHYRFMDDLKLFGKRESQVESLVNTVHTMIKDLEWVFKNAGCWFWRELRWLDVKDLATQQGNNK